MGLPKIDLASLRCPLCASPAKLTGPVESGAPNESELYSFECSACGTFEVLTLKDEGEIIASDRRIAMPGAELRELWA